MYVLGAIFSVIATIIFFVIFLPSFFITSSVLIGFILISIIIHIPLLILYIIAIFLKLIPSSDKFYKLDTKFLTPRKTMKIGYYGGFILNIIVSIMFIIVITKIISELPEHLPIMRSSMAGTIIMIIILFLIDAILYLIGQFGLIDYLFKLDNNFHAPGFRTAARVLLISIILSILVIIPLIGSIIIFITITLVIAAWMLIYEESNKQLNTIK